MGSGTSTIGRLLGRLTGLEFIDLDDFIEKRYCATVRELFAARGEAWFRSCERDMLHEVGEWENVVVACGGGTPCYFDNMEWMNAHGTTVYLDASIERLHERLLRGQHKRPLIADKSEDELRTFIVDALLERMPYYEKASLHFNANLLGNEQEKEVTARRLAETLHLPTFAN
jgi:shikimate kinase